MNLTNDETLKSKGLGVGSGFREFRILLTCEVAESSSASIIDLWMTGEIQIFEVKVLPVKGITTIQLHENG
jgi:hypothetical protein